MSFVGQVVADRYRLMGVIGRGGHSVVYRAEERSGELTCAVKILHPGIPDLPELEARMEREHEVLRSLEGTAAPRVFLLSRHQGCLCLVMEFLRGQDLDEYLADIEAQGYKLEVPTLVELLGPIVETLEFAHERGIVHRDLKPGNIFVLGRGGPGGVRLLDFGLAGVTGRKAITRDGIVIGSPSYIAPEVWQGNPRALDLRVDVYAFGAIIFRALSGSVPFPVSGMKEKLEAATRAERPSLHELRPDLPRSVDDWVRQALAVDREQRFSRVRGMWNALLATLGVRHGGIDDGIHQG